ncbi:MAG: nicotinate-nucleotide adenylyltransferase [Planctomycetota bacterium]|nr:MAG: nicotinate-nucleotide adenylyltransferase [Planctomycetota bacterium]
MEIVETGVIHGRFQVLHYDHIKYLMAGKSRCKHLVVGITNPDPTLTGHDDVDENRSAPQANPLTYFERYRIVRAALLEQGLNVEEFSIVPFPINFPELYEYYVPTDATFLLTIYDEWGEKKLKMFESLGYKVEVLWRRPLSEKGQTSTEIRGLITAGESWEHLVPPSVSEMLKKLGCIERIKII